MGCLKNPCKKQPQKKTVRQISPDEPKKFCFIISHEVAGYTIAVAWIFYSFFGFLPVTFMPVSSGWSREYSLFLVKSFSIMGFAAQVLCLILSSLLIIGSKLQSDILLGIWLFLNPIIVFYWIILTASEYSKHKSNATSEKVWFLWTVEISLICVAICLWIIIYDYYRQIRSALKNASQV